MPGISTLARHPWSMMIDDDDDDDDHDDDDDDDGDDGDDGTPSLEHNVCGS